MAKYKYKQIRGKNVRIYKGGWDGYTADGHRKRLLNGRLQSWQNYLKKKQKVKEKAEWQVWVGGFLYQDNETGEFEYVKGEEWTQKEEPNNKSVWKHLNEIYNGTFYKQYTKNNIQEMTYANMTWGARLVSEKGAVLKELLV